MLQLFSSLSQKLGTSILYISHDLLSVSTISHRVAVMEKGKIVECRSTPEIFSSPTHPYTQQLMRALPVPPKFAKAASAGIGEIWSCSVDERITIGKTADIRLPVH